MLRIRLALLAPLIAILVTQISVGSARAAPGEVTSFLIPAAEGSPWAIGKGPDGNLWFSQPSTNKVGRITPSGEVTEFSVPVSPHASSGGGEPGAITAGPDGNLWLVMGNGGQIDRITPLGEVTPFTAEEGSDTIGGIAVGSDGNLWFAEWGENKIGRATTDGQVTAFAIPTDGSHPQEITAGPDGDLWFTEESGSKIGRITTGGQITEYPVATKEPDELEDISAGPDENVWFAEPYLHQLGRINTSGQITYFPTGELEPRGIAASPDESLWVIPNFGHSVYRFNLLGQRTGTYAIPVQDGEPRHIVFGPEGNMWVTANSAIVRVTPGPVIPMNLTLPSIAGAPEPGQTLTVSPGSWTGSPESYSYQWQFCRTSDHSCGSIANATGPTYVPTRDELGEELRVKVIATNAGGESETATSAQTANIGIHLDFAMHATGELLPSKLPRSKPAAATLKVGFTSSYLNRDIVSPLDSIAIDLSRHVYLHTEGLPSCPLRDLYSTTKSAAKTCARSLIGHGSVDSEVALAGEKPVRVYGRLFAFYSDAEGQPRILAQVRTRGSLSLIYVIPFQIGKVKGSFGTSLVAARMHQVLGICARSRGGDCYDQPYKLQGIYTQIASFTLSLGRRFARANHRESIVTASCPRRSASLPGKTFPLANISLRPTLSESPGLADLRGPSTSLSEVVSQKCDVSG